MPLMIIAVFAAVMLTSCDKPDPDDDPTTNISTGSTSSDDTNKSNKMWVVSSLTETNSDGNVISVEKYDYDKKGRIVQITNNAGDTLTVKYTADAIYFGSDTFLVENGLIVHDEYNTIEYSDGHIRRAVRQPNRVKTEACYNWDGNFLTNFTLTETWPNESPNGTRVYTYNFTYIPLENIHADCARFINAFAFSSNINLYLAYSGCYGEIPSGGVVSETQCIRPDATLVSVEQSYDDNVDTNGCLNAFIIRNFEGNEYRCFNLTWRQITIE